MQHKLIFFVLIFFLRLQTVDMYFCTAADSSYFDRLLNLIGSIHKTNFENLKEIAIFDLGLFSEQLKELQNIKKVKTYKIELTNKDLLTPFKINEYKSVKGWYAWKPVIVKQSLDIFPYVFWIDAGATVLKPLDNLFKYIIQNGYFLITIGDNIKNNEFVHNIKWQTTKYLIDKFHIDTKQKRWILHQEAIAATFVGVSKKAFNEFVSEWYEFTKDLQNFADDGTTPQGFGTSRHDQSILGLLAYLKGLKILKQDFTQECPIYLNIDNQEIPFYITWNSKFVDDKTNIYHSRNDLGKYQEYLKCIRYK